MNRTHYISYANNQIKVVNKTNGQVIQSVPQTSNESEDDEIVNFAASESGEDNHIAIAFRSGLIRLYQWTLSTDDPNFIAIAPSDSVSSPPTVKMIKCWKSAHVGPIVLMRFDPNGSNLLATGGSDGNVIIWDLVGQYVTHFLKGCKGVITLIEFEQNPSKDQYRLAVSGSHDNKVHVWNLRSSSLLATFDGHCSEVTAARFFYQNCHFSEDGDSQEPEETLLLTVSRDKIGVVWSIVDQKSVRKIPIYDSISSLILIPRNLNLSFLKREMSKGRLFVVAGEKGELSFWDAVTGVCQAKVRVCGSNVHDTPDATSSNKDDVKGERTLNNPQMITQLLFDDQTDQLTVVTFENNIFVFDLLKLKLIKTYAGHNDEILDLRLFGPDEQFVAVATNSSTLKVFETSSNNCMIVKAHDDIIIGLQTFAFCPTLLATASKDQTFKLWRYDSNERKIHCLYKGLGHDSAVTALGVPYLSVDWIISGSEDNTIKIWSIPSIFDEEQSDNQPVMQNLISQSTVHAHDKLINCVAVSPNDRLIATCSNDKLAKIWKLNADTFTITLLGTLSGHRRAVWSVTFSSVDQVIASSSADSTVRLWSLADYSCLKSFQGHESSVFKVLFATRGLQMITSSLDGNVKIWNVKDADCVATIDAHKDKIYAMSLSQDEQTLVTGSFDSQIKIWGDVSVRKAEEQRKTNEKQLEAQSVLQNLLLKRQWRKAVKFSLMLQQPFTTLKIFKEMMFDLPGSSEREAAFNELLTKLNDHQMATILRYSVSWNTTHRHCEATQLLLHSAIQVHGERLFSLPNSPEVLQKLEPYLRKHFQRFDRLMQTVTFFDFLYGNMKMNDRPTTQTMTTSPDE